MQIEERSEEEGEFLCSSRREKKGTTKRMFQSGNRYRFCTPKRRRGLGCRLRVNGEVVSEPQELLATWVDHFGMFAQLRVSTEPELQELEHKVADLLS